MRKPNTYFEAQTPWYLSWKYKIGDTEFAHKGLVDKIKTIERGYLISEPWYTVLIGVKCELCPLKPYYDSLSDICYFDPEDTNYDVRFE